MHRVGEGERPGSLTGKACCPMSQPMRAVFTKLLSQRGLPLTCAHYWAIEGGFSEVVQVESSLPCHSYESYCWRLLCLWESEKQVVWGGVNQGTLLAWTGNL